MTLNLPSLKQALTDLGTDPPETAPEVAAAWADAMKSYASSLTPPSAALMAACGALQSSLAAAFDQPNTVPQIEAAFAAFALAVAGGMAPAFAGAPPPTPVGFVALTTPPYPDSASAGADAVANLVDAWMKKGTATPPSGPPVLWL